MYVYIHIYIYIYTYVCVCIWNPVLTPNFLLAWCMAWYGQRTHGKSESSATLLFGIPFFHNGRFWSTVYLAFRNVPASFWSRSSKYLKHKVERWDVIVIPLHVNQIVPKSVLKWWEMWESFDWTYRELAGNAGSCISKCLSDVFQVFLCIFQHLGWQLVHRPALSPRPRSPCQSCNALALDHGSQDHGARGPRTCWQPWPGTKQSTYDMVEVTCCKAYMLSLKRYDSPPTHIALRPEPSQNTLISLPYHSRPKSNSTINIPSTWSGTFPQRWWTILTMHNYFMEFHNFDCKLRGGSQLPRLEELCSYDLKRRSWDIQ